LATCEVSAVALTGGAVSLVGGSGSCNKSQVIPLNTPQDTFALAVINGLQRRLGLGGTAQRRFHRLGRPAHGGLRHRGTGAAEVSLIDQWIIGVPVGTAPGSVFTLPAAFRLEGDIVTGSTFWSVLRPISGTTASRSASWAVFRASFNAVVKVASTGHFDQTFSGLLSITYFGAAVPTLANFEMQLLVLDLTQGDIDFSPYAVRVSGAARRVSPQPRRPVRRCS
jgi:hypothetical protein